MRDYPRLRMLLILAAAGAVGFLASVLLLRAGVESMSLRYAASVAVGYLVFLGLIRAWLALRRRRWNLDPDVTSGPDLGTAEVPTPPFSGGGGHFGGGGASGSFDVPR